MSFCTIPYEHFDPSRTPVIPSRLKAKIPLFMLVVKNDGHWRENSGVIQTSLYGTTQFCLDYQQLSLTLSAILSKDHNGLQFHLSKKGITFQKQNTERRFVDKDINGWVTELQKEKKAKRSNEPNLK